MGAASEDAAPIAGYYNTESNVCSTPTLSRTFAVASFQSAPVGSSILTAMPPNLATYRRVGARDKSWDKTANYFETASPQFHFCPGDKNGLVLRLGTALNGCQNGWSSSLAPV